MASSTSSPCSADGDLSTFESGAILLYLGELSDKLTFSVADILMADVLRVVDWFDGLAKFPACRAYVARATARPAFVKAYEDQMAHFAAADAAFGAERLTPAG